MDVLLFILAGLFIVAGTAGSVLPVLPGVPLGYAGLLLLQLTDRVQYSATFLVAWAAAVVVIQVLDYYIPVWGTKRFGGTRAGTVGSTVGIVAGLFLGPWGVVLGPFAGAVLGGFLYHMLFEAKSQYLILSVLTGVPFTRCLVLLPHFCHRYHLRCYPFPLSFRRDEFLTIRITKYATKDLHYDVTSFSNVV